MKWFLLVTLFGCAQVTSLNLKKHEFGVQPEKIIWFQIAGLEEEQLALLRFWKSDNLHSSFEENTCMGNTWGYNLYHIRNSSQETFLAQITGKKNIKESCEDADLKPIWTYLSSKGYNTGILETGANKSQSIISMTGCGEKGLTFLSNAFYWLRQEASKDSKYYQLSDIPLQINQIYYDQSCSGTTCQSQISEHVRATYAKLRNFSHKHLMIIRDFSYLSALEKKDFKEAKRILADLERAYSEALAMSRDSSDTLVLLTTGDSRFVDLPNQGKGWYELEKSNKDLDVKRTKLTNLVLASGARSENFCGIYDDADVFERILSGPKQQGLEFKIINPFK